MLKLQLVKKSRLRWKTWKHIDIDAYMDGVNRYWLEGKLVWNAYDETKWIEEEAEEIEIWLKIGTQENLDVHS